MALTKVRGEGVGALTSDLTIADKIIHDGDTNTAIRFPSADTVTFETGGSERARVDSSGNVMMGTTQAIANSDANDATAGALFFGMSASQTGTGVHISSRRASPLVLNRMGDDGSIVTLNKAGATVGNIATWGGELAVGRLNAALLFDDDANRIKPHSVASNTVRDNALDFGGPSARWDDIYATNGTIQTSDRNEKQDIAELSDAEARVAVVAKGLMRKFRWKSAVAEKGDDARTHFGIIAQDLQDAFTAESLDASDYAMFISTTWWEKEISVDAVEADEANDIEAKDAYTYIDTKDEATEGYTEKTRLGVRYSELLAFIISAI